MIHNTSYMDKPEPDDIPYSAPVSGTMKYIADTLREINSVPGYHLRSLRTASMNVVNICQLPMTSAENWDTIVHVLVSNKPGDGYAECWMNFAEALKEAKKQFDSILAQY